LRADWTATFRNWMRKAADMPERQPSPAYSRSNGTNGTARTSWRNQPGAPKQLTPEQEKARYAAGRLDAIGLLKDPVGVAENPKFAEKAREFYRIEPWELGQ
jgi:hypothetical protein